MKTVDFFKNLQQEGSIEKLSKKYPQLTRQEIDKHFQKVFDELTDLADEGIYELFTDGASKGNPGNAGIGFVIKKDNFIIEEKSKYIGKTTNNVAEYTALIEGLKRAKELGIKNIYAFSDSELLVRQVNGEYAVKNSQLKKLFIETKRIIGSFEQFSLKHIPREKNGPADKLSKQGATSHST